MTRLFPLWAVLASVAAYLRPGILSGLGSWIVPLLMVIMFGMGVTLGPEDFRRVARRPWVIALGTALQFGIMPLAALGIAALLRLPPELAAGLIVVGCAPGGTASNVICYLARADVALSISLTSVSTLLATLATPALILLLVGEAVPVGGGALVSSVVQVVLVPVLLGMLVNGVAGERSARLRDWLPNLSVAAIVLVIAIIVSLNRDTMAESGALVAAAVLLHNLAGLGLGYLGGRILRLPEAAARTLSIEVGMQNSGLGVALALQFLSPLAALPGAVFSIVHNLTGSTLAWWWNRRAPESA